MGAAHSAGVSLDGAALLGAHQLLLDRHDSEWLRNVGEVGGRAGKGMEGVGWYGGGMVCALVLNDLDPDPERELDCRLVWWWDGVCVSSQ